MKITRSLLTLAIGVAMIVFVGNCTSMKAQNKSSIHSLVVYLNNNLGIDYLKETYTVDGYKESLRMSKSENKYQVDFLLDNNKFILVQKKLKEDKNVEKIELVDLQPIPSGYYNK